MNDHDSRDPLHPILRGWEHTPAPAPDFADGVWSRIRSSESSASIIRFPFAIPLPLAACVAVTFSVLAGTFGALALNHAQTADRMAAAYVRTIDPIQMTGGHDHLPPQS